MLQNNLSRKFRVFELGRKDQEPRTVFLACCHSEMEKIFRAFGFREQRGGDIPFAFRTPPPHVDLSLGASHWLVNFDWGDNGVRPPFRDQGSNRNVRALL